jgi:hypothetical protein
VVDAIGREKYRTALLRGIEYLRSVLKCDRATAVLFLRVVFACIKLVILWKGGQPPTGEPVQLALGAGEDELLSMVGTEADIGAASYAQDPDAEAALSVSNGVRNGS